MEWEKDDNGLAFRKQIKESVLCKPEFLKHRVATQKWVVSGSLSAGSWAIFCYENK